MEENRIHHVHLLRGVTKPKEEFAGLRESEDVKGLAWRIIVLSIVNAIALGLIGYYAAQKLNLPSQAANSPQISEGLIKGMAAGGAAFSGLIMPIITMLVTALIFWIFFRDVGYKKLFAIELYLQVINLIGAIISGILMILFHSMGQSSVLSLGAVSSIFTNNVFVNTFFTGISLFMIWKVYVQVQAYRKASVKSTSYIVWVTILINIAFLLISAGAAAFSKFFSAKMQNLQPPTK